MFNYLILEESKKNCLSVKCEKSEYYLNNLENVFFCFFVFFFGGYQHTVEKHSDKWLQMMKEGIDNLIMVQSRLLF